jgi:hypothetical protein
MKNAVFWDVTSCGSCKNRRFGGTYRLLHHGGRVSGLGTVLTVITLLVEAIRSSEPSVLKEQHSVTSQKTSFFMVIPYLKACSHRQLCWC